MPAEDMRLGQLCYEGYLAQTGGVSLVSGQSLPPWDGLEPSLQIAWAAAALNVVANLH